MRWPFRVKLTLFAGVLAAVPLLLMGGVLSEINAEALIQSRWQMQIALADDLARTLTTDTRSAESTLSAMAGIMTDAELPLDARLASAARMLESSPTLDQVAIYADDGTLVDRLRQSDAQTLPSPDILSVDVRGERLRRGAVVVGPALAQAQLTYPMRSGGEVQGWVAAPLSLAGLQTRVERLTQNHLSADEGAMRVVDASGLVLAASSRDEVGRTRTDPVLDEIDPAALAAPRSSDFGDVVATVAPLAEWPWAVVVEVPANRAYATLHRMRIGIGVGIGITLLIALLVAAFLARRITAPIALLSGFARDLAARRFERRVEIQTNDELAQLGRDLSATAEALQESEAQVRSEQAIRKDLGRFLPSELVDKVVQRDHDMQLGGQKLPITVMFADVVAFTPLTQQLAPETLVALLNELFTLLTEIVFRHNGTVDKFVGDAVMAIFGAPDPQDDHASRAIITAMDMLSFVETANPGWKERYGVTIQLAVGIHSGDAVVGNLGSESRMEYTAIGEVVNLASRLEAMARPNQILVSDATRHAVGDAFTFGELGPQDVAGHPKPVRLFEVQP